MDYSHPAFLALRRLGQRLGILRPCVRAYRRIFNLDYEETFDKEILRRIKSGDIVWDIGANVGYFTKKFASIAGTSGQIVAFEPSQGSFEALRAATGALQNVRLENAALSNFDGQADFQVSDDKNDPTNSLTFARSDSTEKVAVRRGDTYCAEHPDLIPHRIKIDVEGFEYEVLDGLTQTLKLPQLRSLFVEVHFAVLAARGFPAAPARITRLLRERGFHVKWVDPLPLRGVQRLIAL